MLIWPNQIMINSSVIAMMIYQTLLAFSIVPLLTGTVGFPPSTSMTTLDQSTLIAQTTSPTASPAEPSEVPPAGGCPGHHPPNFAAAATQLGVSEADLIAALGLPPKPPTLDENGHPQEPPPRLDIPGAAQRLGVTEDRLIEVLGLPPRPPGAEEPHPSKI